jgi:hypothetical protein
MTDLGWATPAEAASAAQSWSLQVLECRTWGHNWQITAKMFVARYRYYAMTWTCACGTQRHREMNKRGAVFATWYTYPDGYLSDVGRIAGDAKDVLRAAVMDRLSVPTSMSDEEPHSENARQAAGIRQTA